VGWCWGHWQLWWPNVVREDLGVCGQVISGWVLVTALVGVLPNQGDG